MCYKEAILIFSWELVFSRSVQYSVAVCGREALNVSCVMNIDINNFIITFT